MKVQKRKWCHKDQGGCQTAKLRRIPSPGKQKVQKKLPGTPGWGSPAFLRSRTFPERYSRRASPGEQEQRGRKAASGSSARPPARPAAGHVTGQHGRPRRVPPGGARVGAGAGAGAAAGARGRPRVGGRVRDRGQEPAAEPRRAAELGAAPSN